MDELRGRHARYLAGARADPNSLATKHPTHVGIRPLPESPPRPPVEARRVRGMKIAFRVAMRVMMEMAVSPMDG